MSTERQLSQSLATKVELPQKLPFYHHFSALLQPGGLESSARAAGEIYGLACSRWVLASSTASLALIPC
jgi:hypothetical protein